MKEDIHIAMVIRKKITDLSYCGQMHSKYFVSENFYLPGKLMCNICVDEWENEDIRMKTPQKINNVCSFEKKYFPKQYEKSHQKTTKLTDLNEKD